MELSENQIAKTSRKYFFKEYRVRANGSLYAEDLDSEPRVILDPNTFSDGTIATTLSFSKDGRFLAYARSESGSDWQEIHVLDIAAGSFLPDAIRWCVYLHPWLPDGSGFLYPLPEPGSVPPMMP